VKAKGKVLDRSLGALLARGLIEEVQVLPGEQAWRHREGEDPTGLKITKSGRKAIGLETIGDEADRKSGDDSFVAAICRETSLYIYAV